MATTTETRKPKTKTAAEKAPEKAPTEKKAAAKNPTS